MSELEDVSLHIQDKISSLQRMMDLSRIGETDLFVYILFFLSEYPVIKMCPLSPHSELPQNKMKKLGQELFALERLLEDFEKCVGRQREQLKHLKVQNPSICAPWCMHDQPQTHLFSFSYLCTCLILELVLCCRNLKSLSRRTWRTSITSRTTCLHTCRGRKAQQSEDMCMMLYLIVLLLLGFFFSTEYWAFVIFLIRRCASNSFQMCVLTSGSVSKYTLHHLYLVINLMW